MAGLLSSPRLLAARYVEGDRACPAMQHNKASGTRTKNMADLKWFFKKQIVWF